MIAILVFYGYIDFIPNILARKCPRRPHDAADGVAPCIGRGIETEDVVVGGDGGGSPGLEADSGAVILQVAPLEKIGVAVELMVGWKQI